MNSKVFYAANEKRWCRLFNQNYITLIQNYVTVPFQLHGSFEAKKEHMKTIKLKTDIMCGSCVANVTPTLNETLGPLNWQVDTTSPSKILTVTTKPSVKGTL